MEYKVDNNTNFVIYVCLWKTDRKSTFGFLKPMSFKKNQVINHRNIQTFL